MTVVPNLLLPWWRIFDSKGHSSDGKAEQRQKADTLKFIRYGDSKPFALANNTSLASLSSTPNTQSALRDKGGLATSAFFAPLSAFPPPPFAFFLTNSVLLPPCLLDLPSSSLYLFNQPLDTHHHALHSH